MHVRRLGTTAAQALGEALAVNTRLKSLRLCANVIGNRGCTAIASGLRQNTTLLSLFLAANSISNAGGEAMAKALCVTTALTTLTLSCNMLSDLCCAAIMMAVVRHPSMSVVCVGGCEAGKFTVQAIETLIQRNQRISFLGFGDPREPEALCACLGQLCETVRDSPRYDDLGILFYHRSKALADRLGLPEDHEALSNFESLHEYYRSRHMCKILGFLMGQHPRLGASSVVSTLRNDVATMIVGAFFGVPAAKIVSSNVTNVHE
jgi:hypothetical protein